MPVHYKKRHYQPLTCCIVNVEWARGRRKKAPYLPTGSSSTRCPCSEQENLKIEALMSYSQIKLEIEIPTTPVPRLNKVQICRIAKAESLNLPYLCFDAPRF